jgi:hypothetical protein
MVSKSFVPIADKKETDAEERQACDDEKPYDDVSILHKLELRN